MSTGFKANAEFACGFVSSSKPNFSHTQLSRLPLGPLSSNFSNLSMASTSGISQSKRVCSLSKNDYGESSSRNGGLTYKDAGVDIDAGSELVRRIAKMAPGIGGFGGLFPLGDSYLVAGTDGVGTKLKLAFDTGIHESIGIDLVAMSVNDIITSGAKPLFFLDYFATSHLDVDLAEKVIRGIVDGCQQSDCALLGGETAEMPDFYADGEYDLSGFAVGIVKKESVIDGKNIVAGDVLIGLPSSGVHSNGFSLVRRVLAHSGLSLKDQLPGESVTLGEALMAPTVIYVKQVLDLISKGGIKGLAHITGGGFTDNIPRVFPKGLGSVIYNGSWEVPAIFKKKPSKQSPSLPSSLKKHPLIVALSISLSLSLRFASHTISSSQIRLLLDPQLEIMSDQGEKTCPLCAEEMDLTDQQLKPCKCGYEICVWCWHHIMDMAEKDDTEGRCPACRTPYDKEKIVGAAKCERLVAEIHTERKKSQKTKVKPTSDGRKQLSSVRVIQRNLVYIVGLPLNLADEDLLQRREYFAQYGKVLKVSMSRTAAGVIQQFPNNTCSVYITYSKEEEAVRCIQNVHGFLLDGRSLRACFGTTKYCHAWLRNVPCTNPDCLYLHEVGCHEDSFTKDEIISAYTRSRVQQITGTLNPMQRRSGSVLPPPLDDYCNSSSASAGGTVIKNGSNNTGSFIKGSPPNGSSGRSIALPAAASWGTRGSNSQLPATQIIYSNGHTRQRPDTVSCSVPFSLAAAPTAHASIVHSDVGKRSTLNDDSQTMHARGKPESLKIVKQQISMDSQSTLSDKPATPDEAPASVNVSSQLSCPQASKDNNRGSSMQPTISTATDHNQLPFSSCRESESIVSTEGVTQSLCSDISLMSIDGNSILDHSGVVRPNNSPSDNLYIKSLQDQGLQQYCAEQSKEPPITTERAVTREQSNWLSESQPLPSIASEVEEDVLSFDNQRLMDPEVNRAPYLPSLPNAVHVSNHSRSPLLPSEAYGAVYSNADRLFVDNKIRDSSLLSSSNVSVQSNGYHENLVSSSSGSEKPLEHSFLHRNEGPGKHGRRFLGDAANPDFCNAVDKGESSIISNILSMDFDTWDDPISSPQNFSKFLGESDRQSGAQKMSCSWKVPNNNQSRFSFARQEDSRNQGFDLQSSQNVIGRLSQNQAQNHSFHHGFSENRDLCLDNLGIGNGFPSSTFEESENHASNLLAFSSNKISAVSRAQVSAPPGFSVPSRAPPPGFTSHERVDRDFETLSGNHLHDNSSLLRNAYQSQPTGNIGTSGDIEFMDPAILAVGKGRLQGGLNNPGLDMRSNFPSQLSAFENDARLQLLMQRSFSQQQNLRYPDFGDGFSHVNDSYGISSRLLDQSQASNISPFAQLSLQQSRNNRSMSNGHWDGWNEVQGGNTMGMAELLRNERVNERLGFNKFYSGYEESKFRMPNSGDLYNRTFGM